MDRLLLNGVYLSEEQIEKYKDILSPLPKSMPLPNTETELAAAAERLNKSVCSSFTRDNYGFTATFSDESDRLVFFSIPWDAGWSATVNGTPVEIENVSGGMMAVRVPAGESEIRFDYETPGLKTGLVITFGALILWIGYLSLVRRIDPRCVRLTGKRNRHGAAVCRMDEIPLERAYADTILRESARRAGRPRRLYQDQTDAPDAPETSEENTNEADES